MRKISRPSPAMIVALIALFVALGGSGYAALSGKDKKKVRAIADQQIAAKAGGLSVANAASAQSAANAANAQNAANATNAQNAANATNANALGGFPSGGFVRAFGANDVEQDQDEIFSVPELQISILGDNALASGFVFRIRNDSSTATVIGSDLNDHTSSVLSVAPSTTSNNVNLDGPVMLTSAANPELLLLVQCGAGVGARNYCFGQLHNAPTD
jgi:hypothetical protein